MIGNAEEDGHNVQDMFRKYDSKNTGFVSRREFTDVLNLLPHSETLSKVDENGLMVRYGDRSMKRVNYRSLLKNVTGGKRARRQLNVDTGSSENQVPKERWTRGEIVEDHGDGTFDVRRTRDGELVTRVRRQSIRCTQGRKSRKPKLNDEVEMREDPAKNFLVVPRAREVFRKHAQALNAHDGCGWAAALETIFERMQDTTGDDELSVREIVDYLRSNGLYDVEYLGSKNRLETLLSRNRLDFVSGKKVKNEEDEDSNKTVSKCPDDLLEVGDIVSVKKEQGKSSRARVIKVHIKGIVSCTSSEADLLRATFDADGSGRVDKDDFLAFMSNEMGDEQIEMLKDRLRSELRKGIGTIFFFDSFPTVTVPSTVINNQQHEEIHHTYKRQRQEQCLTNSIRTEMV